jgi:hypothetical protein
MRYGEGSERKIQEENKTLWEEEKREGRESVAGPGKTGMGG